MRTRTFEKFILSMSLLFLGVIFVGQNAHAGTAIGFFISPAGFKLQFIGLGVIYISARLAKSSPEVF